MCDLGKQKLENKHKFRSYLVARLNIRIIKDNLFEIMITP